MAKKQPEIVSKCLDWFAEDKRPHDKFVEKVERNYKCYRGILERRSEAAQWTNKQHPAIVLQSIETMVANLLSPSPKWKLRARPLIDSPEAVAQAQLAAKANELLLAHQIVLDGFAQKQRTFDLQALITGLTASKQFWLHKEGEARYLSQTDPVYDLFGNEVLPSRMVPDAQDVVLRDDPTMEVVDVRHLIPQQGAVSLGTCERVTHRVFFPFSRLKELEKRGIYGTRAGGVPVDELKETKADHQGFVRENELFQTQPHKDDIELLEVWCEGGKRVVTIANGGVLLADKPNPFWFDYLEHPFPFVTCSGMPDLFRIHGISEVELIADLQEMLWTLMNQRLDSLQLVANAIALIADDVEDPEAFEFAPGERWLVPRPVEETVKMWSPDIKAAMASLQAEELVRGDVQNVTGGMPFLSGTSSQGVDQQTATGVSIITTLAQKRLAGKQQQFIWAKALIGAQWCALNQQYVRSTRIIPVIGADGAEAFEEVRPEYLQGRCVLEPEMVDESMMRSERRAESTAKFQIAVQSQGVMAASQTPLNLRAFMDDVLDAYDISDKERYYTQAPPGPGAQQGAGGGASQPGQNGSPNGVTNPALAAGPSSPSNANSMSGEQFMQRLGALRGGAANASG